MFPNLPICEWKKLFLGKDKHGLLNQYLVKQNGDFVDFNNKNCNQDEPYNPAQLIELAKGQRAHDAAVKKQAELLAAKVKVKKQVKAIKEYDDYYVYEKYDQVQNAGTLCISRHTLYPRSFLWFRLLGVPCSEEMMYEEAWENLEEAQEEFEMAQRLLRWGQKNN